MRIALVHSASCTCAMAFSATLMQIVQLQALCCYQQSHEHMHLARNTMCLVLSTICHNTQGILQYRQSRAYTKVHVLQRSSKHARESRSQYDEHLLLHLRIAEGWLRGRDVCCWTQRLARCIVTADRTWRSA